MPLTHSFSKSAFSAGVLAIAAATFAPACGARSSLIIPAGDGGLTGDATVVGCSNTSDCPNDDPCSPQECVHGGCIVNAVKCDDGDPCTDDFCQAGKCGTRIATLDLDGDGHKGAKPGTKPGAPGSCGDDCDDARASAFPGNKETCDGVDNDCNGIIDDGAQYRPEVSGPAAVRVSSTALEQGYPGGIAHDGTRYFAAYTGKVDGKQRIFGTLLAPTGQKLPPGETRLSQVESDAFVGDVVWTGDRYATVWSDRRSGGFDIFFAMFDRDGKKMQPGDVSIVSTDVFSINASLVWTGREFVVVWQEGQGETETFQVMGRRIDIDGTLLGEAVQLTEDGGETPSIAVGQPGLGLTFGRTTSSAVREVWFRPIDFTLGPLGPPVRVSPNQGEPSYADIAWNQPHFVITWTDQSGRRTAYGALLDGTGNVALPATPITNSPRFVRDPSLIPLGDRFLLVYADTRDQNQGFELYSQMLDAKLTPGAFGPPARLTNAPRDSSNPVARLGVNGDVSVLFRDDRTGGPQAYFTRLVCTAGQ